MGPAGRTVRGAASRVGELSVHGQVVGHPRCAQRMASALVRRGSPCRHRTDDCDAPAGRRTGADRPRGIPDALRRRRRDARGSDGLAAAAVDVDSDSVQGRLHGFVSVGRQRHRAPEAGKRRRLELVAAGWIPDVNGHRAEFCGAGVRSHDDLRSPTRVSRLPRRRLPRDSSVRLVGCPTGGS